MLKHPRIPPKLRSYIRPLCLMALSFALSAAQLGGTYAPCALAIVALAGPKLPGLSCLLGAAAGAFAFFDFQPGLRFLASAILIFAVNTAFYDTDIYTRRHFRPAASAAVTLLVESVYLAARPLQPVRDCWPVWQQTWPLSDRKSCTPPSFLPVALWPGPTGRGDGWRGHFMP